MDLSTVLKDTAGKFAEKTAIYFKGRAITFSELDKSAGRFAVVLREIGVGKSDRVGILLKNSPDFVTALFGSLRNGSVVVPLNTFLQPPEIEFICDDSQLKTLVTSKDFVPAIQSIREKLPSIEKILLTDIDENVSPDFESLGKLMEASDATAPGIEIDGDDDAVFLYTSGTTGTPKAAVLSHANFISDVESANEHIRITPEDSFLLVLPMFHAFCLTVNVIIPVHNGSSIVMLESIRPLENVLKAIMAHRPTIFAGVPQIFGVLTHKPLPPGIVENLPLRLCISGSAPLDEKTLRSFEEKFKIPLVEGYGLSEAAPVVSMNPLDGVRKVNSIGLPLPGIEVKIFDEDGDELPTGDVGEIVVRGRNVMKRYHNRPEETAAALKDGWLHTGDVGTIDEDGYIFIVDRKKELIISKGMKIYPREIERLLYSHPKVQGVAVVGRQKEGRDELPVAYVMLNKGEEATSKEIIGFIKPKLAPYKLPREVVFVEDFPRTATGKILKRKLGAM